MPVRGLPRCLESVGYYSLVVEVGTGTTPCHNGAGYAIRCEFGPHNGVIQGQVEQNSLRMAQPALRRRGCGHPSRLSDRSPLPGLPPQTAKSNSIDN